ncbi:MAG: thioredoxin-disulfide reductase [Clostridia bacterium]|nr:thioredoxin-disulfide reductase [Clostridia bacterium]
MSKVYDMIILGGGPAGLTAGLYGGRGRRSVLIIEKGQDGGQIATTNEIENYPGQLLEGETGPSLVERMSRQAAKFGCERVSDTVKAVELEGDVKKVVGNKGEYLCRALIIAAGAYARPIGCENEERFRGSGISYCATCDAAFFEDLEVYVVGGGDAAVEEAMYLTKFARKVTIIHRRDQLRAAKSIQEKAFANPKIDFMWDTVVQSVDGEDVLCRMVVKNTKTGELTTIEANEEDGIFGLFGFIGLLPNSEIFHGKLAMENGYILTDEDMRTDIPGVFAAGDIRKKSLRQVVTAAADGAIAAMSAEHYISNME